MQDPLDPMDRRDIPVRPRTDGQPPGKLAMIALACLVAVALLGAFLVSISDNRHEVAGSDELASFAQPSDGQIKECNQYAALIAQQGTSAVEPPPPIDDGDRGLVGLSDENSDSDIARAAYRDCMLGMHDASCTLRERVQQDSNGMYHVLG
jgi:hypothetical protein